MYCPACGAAIAQGLSYCNFCGAKLNEKRVENISKSPEIKPELLVSSMVGLFIFGLVAIAVLLGVMKQVAGFDMPIILAMTMFSFVLLVVVEGVLIRLLLRGRKETQESGDAAPLKGQATKELDPAQARGLPEPVPSVTEHTTRTFEPVYTERKSK